MTVSSTTNRNLFTGDGATSQFGYDFLIFEAAELLVVLRQADGTELTKTLDTDYSVSGVGLAEGGTVTCLSFVPAADEQLLLQRRIDYVQETSLPANVDMPSATIERQLDRLVMMAQQLDERLDRAVQIPLTSTLTGVSLSDPQAGQALIGNEDGTGFVNLNLASVSGLAVSDYMRTVLDDPTAESARQSLGISGATFEAGDIKWSARLLTADPDGWLLCDGRAVSRTGYADLFAALGESHGEGDGSTTFNIPDYRGRVLRAPDDLGTAAGAAGLDPEAASRTAMASGGNTGGAVGSVQADALQGHSHTDSGHTHTVPTEVSTDVNVGGRRVPNGLSNGTPITTSSSSVSLGDPVENANGAPRVSDETRMANAYVNVLIKI